jgi:uroporphyrin-III C-methyltransferase
MSKQDKEKDAEFPDDDTLLDEVVDAEPVPQLPPPAKVRRPSTGVAWLALLASLLATAGIGYLLVQDWRARGNAANAADSLAVLEDRLNSSGESLSGLDQRLTDLAAADAATAADLQDLQRELNDRIQLFDSLPSRMNNVENSLSSLQGVSTGARNTWLLAEAEYYMQIANAQLQLAGNPHLAALALGMADERIAQLANPALTNVRRALADELAALEIMDKPDIEGITLTLASLARVVDSLPLRPVGRAAADDVAAADEASGAARAWASVKGVVTGLVSHTGPGESAAPLMTPEAEYFLRTNLTLQLQVARLALLRGEQAVFQQSLDDAAAWLETYFDTQSAQIVSARQTVAEIRAGLSDVTNPDISESLVLLRQFTSARETDQ